MISGDVPIEKSGIFILLPVLRRAESRDERFDVWGGVLLWFPVVVNHETCVLFQLG